VRIKLIAVGNRMPHWVQEGYSEYAKRLPREFAVELLELPLGKRGKNRGVQQAIAQEGELMAAAIPAGDQIIALDVQGKSWSTEQLAQRLEVWRMDGVNISLLIGGPDGLAENCVSSAHLKWSLSSLTLPHPLVRVLLIEQLYRAWTILQHHPYHK
jgi:23S rRNA (pseudouridine1915-N3)-methyltransferase